MLQIYVAGWKYPPTPTLAEKEMPSLGQSEVCNRMMLERICRAPEQAVLTICLRWLGHISVSLQGKPLVEMNGTTCANKQVQIVETFLPSFWVSAKSIEKITPHKWFLWPRRRSRFSLCGELHEIYSLVGLISLVPFYSCFPSLFHCCTLFSVYCILFGFFFLWSLSCIHLFLYSDGTPWHLFISIFSLSPVRVAAAWGDV